MMRCPRCLNTDKSYFYKGSRGWYCRRCAAFGRALLEEDIEPAALASVSGGSEEYMLRYPLTEAQARIAAECAAAVAEQDVLLHCVCGAGKTELVVPVIARMLKQGKKVCFAIPRRQVVLELRERLAGYFPRASVIAVCGGHTAVTDGDLIICTTHQLFRYYRAFDLLILDETDAFPYRGSEVLHGIAETACTGRRIYLTATPDEEILAKVERNEVKELRLNVRPHGHPLPVPEIRRGPFLFRLAYLLFWITKRRDKPVIVFVPTIRAAHSLHRLLGMFFPCLCITGQSADRDEVTERFRKEGGLLVATTVFERGVTVANVQVAVLRADHAVFDKASLIQIAGRCGRTFAYPEGDVLFLTGERSRIADSCAAELKECNLSCAV